MIIEIAHLIVEISPPPPPRHIHFDFIAAERKRHISEKRAKKMKSPRSNFLEQKF